MNKTEVIPVILLALILSGCVEGPESDGVGEIVESATYSLAEVSGHNTRNDCWFIINDKVYDVTEFVSGHPGGEAILEGCGSDATDLFETRPMGSGTPHSTGARLLRETYYLGDLS